MYAVGYKSERSEWEDSPNRLKVENLGAGKYRIVVYSPSNSYRGSSIYVKYDHLFLGTYLYLPYDHNDMEMYSEVKFIRTDKKLSSMARGQGSDIIMFYDSGVTATLRCTR
ncbi:hypothetical protein ES705_36717 [subsurface metagenome]